MRDEKQPFEGTIDSLEELADRISEVLACSVTIEDANHRLVAYSSHRPESDPARISTIVGRRVPEKIIQTLWREGVFQKIIDSVPPVRVAAIREIGLGDRLAIAIRKEQSILGYIWVVEEKQQLDESAMLQLLKAARAATAKLLQMQVKRLKEEQGHQDFLWQLLTGHVKTDEAFKAAQETYKLRLPPLFCVHVMEFPGEITEKLYRQLHYMITSALEKRVVLHTISGDRLILLEDGSSGPRAASSANLYALLAEPMRLRFGEPPTTGGCGLTYDHYAQVEQSYREALTVIRMKRQFPQAMAAGYAYSDLGFYRVLPLLREDKSERRYTNKALRELERYDHKHNGNLLLTLETYLTHNSNLKSAADALHIHENTLSYRLKRIAEVGGIDLNSMDEKVSCYLDLKLKACGDREAD